MRRFLGLFRIAYESGSAHNVPRLGASLAFYTLFAIAPVLLVSVGIAGLVFGAQDVRGQIVAQMETLVGSEGARVVQSLLEGASERRAGVIATVVGSVTFLVAASGAFLELQAALNLIWGVKPRPGLNVRRFFLNRARSFGLVVVLGFLLLVSLAVSAALAALSSWLGEVVPGIPAVWWVVNIFVSLGAITLVFVLLYRFLPDVRLRFRDVWVGALVTSILFTAGKELIGLYLGRSSVASSYGAAGAVVVLLLWVYYSSQIVLFGAEFTCAYARDRQAGHGAGLEGGAGGASLETERPRVTR